jgi:YlmC/YmxH family sporulation protein
VIILNDNIKFLSEIEGYEIINLNDGEKYNYLLNNDLIIDNEGYFKAILVNSNFNRRSFFSSNEYIEVPWEDVKKIGSKTIIIDVDQQTLKRTKL